MANLDIWTLFAHIVFGIFCPNSEKVAFRKLSGRIHFRAMLQDWACISCLRLSPLVPFGISPTNKRFQIRGEDVNRL